MTQPVSWHKSASKIRNSLSLVVVLARLMVLLLPPIICAVRYHPHTAVARLVCKLMARTSRALVPARVSLRRRQSLHVLYRDSSIGGVTTPPLFCSVPPPPPLAKAQTQHKTCRQNKNMYACNPQKQSWPVSYLTAQEGVVVGGGNPLLVPGLAEELGGSVLGLILGKVEAEGLEGDGLGDRLGRSGGGRTGGGEGGGRSGEGEDEALREGSHFCLLYKSDCWDC